MNVRAVLLTVFVSGLAMSVHAGLQVTYNSQGVNTLSYNGVTLVDTTANPYDKFTILEIEHIRPDQTRYREYGATPQSSSMDLANKVLTWNYSWGSVKTKFNQVGDRLNMTIAVTNSDPINALAGANIYPFFLRFPVQPTGWDPNMPQVGFNNNGPTIISGDYGTGMAVYCNDDVVSPLHTGLFSNSDTPTRHKYMLWVSTIEFPGQPTFWPAIDRRIPAGGSDTYTVSIRFAPSGTSLTNVAADVFASYAQHWPMELVWPDRRPIASDHLAIPAMGWPNNPRGWFGDANVNVYTPSGLSNFHQRVLSYADYSIGIMSNMNAQGVIVWDIEGEQYPHATSYLGDPRVLPTLAPEMDSVADAFFQKFRDAGFRIGCCVRPQRLDVNGTNVVQTWVGDAEAEQLLIDKITYVHDRWGMTLCYIDSDGSTDSPMDAQIFHRLAQRFPDMLLSPENKNTAYYAYTAPLCLLSMGYITVDPATLMQYPAAFTCNYIPDATNIDQCMPQLVQSVRRGDILMFRGWFDDSVINGQVKSIYQQAGDYIPPTVWMTSPADGAIVTGVTNLAAYAWDNTGVPAGVRFKIDGVYYGTEDTNYPYLVSLDTSLLSQGVHTATAVARDRSGLTNESAPITFSRSWNLLLAIPASATEGDGHVIGTIFTSSPATSNITVNLASGDTTEATVPGTVFVFAGTTSATFAITIVDDAELDGTQVAVITASNPGYNGTSASISIRDNETATLTVKLPANAREGDGVLAGAGHVYVSAPVSTNVTINLSSSDTAEVFVASSVIIPTGQTNAAFDLLVLDDGVMGGARPVTVTAHVDNWTDGFNTMIVFNNSDTNLTVVLTGSATEGDPPVLGRVHIHATMLTNLTVNLVSSDTTEITVTNQVVIPAGQLSGTFNVAIVDDALMDGSQTATVTASAAGFASGSAGITVYDNDVHHFDLAPINSPQAAGIPFGVTITAKDVNGVTIAVYNRSVRLSAAGDSGNVPIQPTNTAAFAGGVWSGNVNMLGVGSNVRLTATDNTSGRTGQSSQFQVSGALMSVVANAVTNVPLVAGNSCVRMLTITNSGNDNLTFTIATNSTANTNGLVLHYSFETNENGVVTDLSGNANTGTVYGATWVSNGKVNGGAYSFNGTNNYILVNDSASLDATNLTVSVWHYYSFSGGTGLEMMLEKGPHDGCWEFMNYLNGYVWIRGGGVSPYVCTDTAISTGTWHHIVTTISNTTATVYIDGLQAKTGQVATVQVTTQQVYIGCSYSLGATQDWLNGKLDEIRIYNRALSSNEVLALYQNPGGVELPGWLSVQGGAGVVPPGGSTNIAVTFDATGCVTGQHVAATLVIVCNDTITPGTNVPLSMDVAPRYLTVAVPASATEGNGVLAGQGHVTVFPAPGTNLAVSLVSSDTSEVTVPGIITIPAGQTTAVFDVTIVDDPILDGSQTVMITASASAYVSGSCFITVHDNESTTLSIILPATILEGSTVTGQVACAGTPYSDVAVSLIWSNYSRLMVPTNVTILSGSNSATFTLTAINDFQMNGSQFATVTAHVVNWVDGMGAITVLDDESTNLMLVLTGSATEGDSPVLGRVRISGTMPTNLTVNLVSSDTTEITVTNRVVIPAGQLSGTFNVAIVDDALMDGSQMATVTASAVGFGPASAGITIYDNDVHHFDLTPINSPQTAGIPFGVTITAKDINGVTIAVYSGSVRLSAAGNSGNVPVQPTNTAAFAGGVWSGNVNMLGAGSNVRLTATNDVIGRGVLSNPFEVGGASISIIPNALTNIPVALDGTCVRTLMITNSGNGNLAFTVAANSNANTNGLVLHYSFETNENGVVTDLSGNANTGTIYGATWVPAGKVNGGAYSFNGTNNYILVNDSASLDATNLTVSVWHYYSFSGGTGLEMMLEKCPHDGCWEFMNYLNGYVWIRGGGVSPYVCTDTAISTGVWHHIVTTISNTTATVYIDGLHAKTGQVATVQLTTQPVYIGCSYNLGAKQDWLHGELDEIRIYNRALSSNEVLALYQSPGGDGFPGWLSVQGGAGVVPPGGSTNIAVTFDATGCVIGQHMTTSIVVTCNDITTPSTNVVVSMDVVAPPTYWLGLSVVGPGSLNVSSGWFATGTNVAITATASNYYHFGSWLGTTNGGIVAGNTIAVCMDRTRNISGRFDENLAANQTPEWWLALNGFTNRAWDVEALDDQDGDGMATWKEYIAGTSPTNPADCLKIVQVHSSSTNPGNCVLVWQTVTGRNYTVMTATNLLSSWTNVPDSAYTNIPGAVPSLCYTNTSVTNSPRYFRIRTRLPQ